jgi:hypothetical protein
MRLTLVRYVQRQALPQPGSRKLGGAQANGFRLFAYRLLPIRYLGEQAEPFEIAQQNIEPLQSAFVSLGFDVVNKTFSAFFECSPLSCNGMADEVAVNRFCLLET